MGILAATLKVLKWPIKLLIRLVKSGSKKKLIDQEQKQLAHVRNFDPTRLNNRSWQQRAGKKLTKKQKEYYRNKRKRKQKSIKPN